MFICFVINWVIGMYPHLITFAERNSRPARQIEAGKSSPFDKGERWKKNAPNIQVKPYARFPMWVYTGCQSPRTAESTSAWFGRLSQDAKKVQKERSRKYR